MNAIPIQASSRYGGRDSTASRLPPISTSRHDDLPGPFAPSSSSIPPADALSTSGGPNPMAIPGADKKMDNVPPPLPPPPLVPIDGPVDPNLYARYGNRDRDALAFGLPRGDLPARDAGIDASQDVGSPSDRRCVYPADRHLWHIGYLELTLSPARSSAFPPPLGYSAMKGFRRYDNSIDSSMLDKLNRPGRRHGLSASFNDLPDHRPSHTQIPTYSLPHRPKQSFLDSTFARSPGAMSATSPIGAPFSHAGGSSFDHRLQSVADSSDFERSPLPRSQRAHNGYETRDDDADFPMEETSRMRGLKIDDPWRERDWDRDRDRDREREKERDGYQAGQKRRASSPLGDEVALANDVLRRRDGGPISRGSPTPRLLVTPQNSLSSVSSMSRSGSYTSNLTASSVTSIGSFGRRSPNALSPSGLSPTEPLGGSSPYPAPPGVSASPRPSMGQGSAAPSPRQQAPSEQPVPLQTTRTVVSPRKLAEIPQNPSGLAAKLKGPYMCECCPKKPKKFETEEELRYVPQLSVCPLLRLQSFRLTPLPQSPRGREAVRVLVLRQPVQEQERSRETSKFSPRPEPELVVFGADGLRAGVPREHGAPRRGRRVRVLRGGVPADGQEPGWTVRERAGLGGACPTPPGRPQVPRV